MVKGFLLYITTMSQTIVPESWAELQEMLFRHSWDERLQRYRSPFVYRGLSTFSYQLETSLMRLGGPYHNLEGHLLRNFKKYAHSSTAPGSSVWNWLAMAQHHGLPTRLLDWTYSPYIALHFATSNLHHYDRDGVIWAVNYVQTNNFLPPILKKVILDEGSHVFTAEMLDEVCYSLRDFDNLQDETYLAWLEPPSIDERIVNQHALFSLLSNPKAMLDDWLTSHPNLHFKIKIPADMKWEIRDKLDQANITERLLFPGLRGLSIWLKRHYAPKEKG